MNERLHHVLFLCTGNSARSILAEALLSKWGKGRFFAHSAGSFPQGEVNPLTLQLLERVKLPTEGLRSKSWNEFTQPGAPPLDFVITVCDQAAGEVCPVWPGQPITAHWGLQDPAAVAGTEAQKLAVFHKVFLELENRIKIFCSLPMASLDRVRIKEHVDEIGKTVPAFIQQFDSGTTNIPIADGAHPHDGSAAREGAL